MSLAWTASHVDGLRLWLTSSWLWNRQARIAFGKKVKHGSVLNMVPLSTRNTSDGKPSKYPHVWQVSGQVVQDSLHPILQDGSAKLVFFLPFRRLSDIPTADVPLSETPETQDYNITFGSWSFLPPLLRIHCFHWYDYIMCSIVSSYFWTIISVVIAVSTLFPCHCLHLLFHSETNVIYLSFLYPGCSVTGQDRVQAPARTT